MPNETGRPTLQIWDSLIAADRPDGIQWMRGIIRDGVLGEGRIAIDYRTGDPPGIDDLVRDVWESLQAATSYPKLSWPDGTPEQEIAVGNRTLEMVADGHLALRHGGLNPTPSLTATATAKRKRLAAASLVVAVCRRSLPRGASRGVVWCG
jgi:hypothetical protein